MRRASALAIVAVAASVLSACDSGDGRQMDVPTEPLPATTTSTTSPPDGGEPLP